MYGMVLDYPSYAAGAVVVIPQKHVASWHTTGEFVATRRLLETGLMAPIAGGRAPRNTNW